MTHLVGSIAKFLAEHAPASRRKDAQARASKLELSERGSPWRAAGFFAEFVLWVLAAEWLYVLLLFLVPLAVEALLFQVMIRNDVLSTPMHSPLTGVLVGFSAAAIVACYRPSRRLLNAIGVVIAPFFLTGIMLSAPVPARFSSGATINTLVPFAGVAIEFVAALAGAFLIGFILHGAAYRRLRS